MAYQFTVSFDPAVLQPTGSSAGSLTSGWARQTNTGIPGEISIAGFDASMESLNGDPGSLCIMNFNVLGQLGASTSLTFKKAKLSDVEGQEIPSGTSNGFFRVEGGYTLSITVNPAGSGTINPVEGNHVYAKGTVVSIEAQAAAGYRFSGWTGPVADAASAATTVTMDSDKTVTANFTRQYTLNISVLPAGSGTTFPSAGQHAYDAGTVVGIEVQAAAGYRFSGWTGPVANAASAATTVTMDSDKTVTANFTRQYTLNISVLPAGSGTTLPSVGQHAYDAGEVVSIEAQAAAGYRFSGWTGPVADAGSATTTVTMNSDKTVTANFTRQYTLNISVSPAGGGTTLPSAGLHIYDAGTVVDINAFEGEGHTFSGWTGPVANAASAATTVTMNSDKTVTANFLPDTFNITVSIAGGNGQAVPAGQVVPYNGTAVIDIIPSAGYSISGIRDNGADALISNPFMILNVKEDHNVVVEFTINVYTVSFLTDSTPGSSIKGNALQQVNHGFSCTEVTAVPPEGYLFVNWTNNGNAYSSDPSITVENVTEDMSLVANFAMQGHTVNIFSLNPESSFILSAPDDNEGKTGGVTPFSMLYRHGADVTLTARFSPGGNRFLKWQKDGEDFSFSHSVSFTVREDCTMTAVYETAMKISAGGAHTAAIPLDGSLWTWGSNLDGQLGDGTGIDRMLPGKTGEDNDWSAVSAGGFHTAALKSDGTLWTWGNNLDGQLGDGTNFGRNLVSRVETETGWHMVSSGRFHTAALKSDGTLWTWGNNLDGQLGDGTKSGRNFPAKIGVDESWVAVSAGWSHTAALKSDGTLWTWGRNFYGQLGDGTTTGSIIPLQVGTGKDWITVSAGSAHTAAVKSDGTLWAWGRNSYGQLGDGTVTSRYSPVRIGTDSDWVEVSAGSAHTAALKADGSLWTWGSNVYGQLGDSSFANSHSPVRVGNDTDWISVSAGEKHTAALKADGTLWTWGGNGSGQLGDGTISDSNLPGFIFGFRKGDINNDGDVNIMDAILCLRMSISLPVTVRENEYQPPLYDEMLVTAADINEDGTVNISDVIGILRLALE